MKCSDIIRYIENWAPPGTAWLKDNAGLQAGAPSEEVTGIMLALELTPGVLDKALKKKCGLIITHHPFIFSPLKSLNFDTDPKSKLLQKLIKNNISLYSAHTNLDFAKGGVSFVLAGKLGLSNIQFLTTQKSNQYKIFVTVPPDFVDKTAEAVFQAGGGVIGGYSGCSFRAPGEGTFFGTDKTTPFTGSRGRFERVEEVKLEVIVESWNLDNAVKALKNAHPYEEPAYDIIKLENENLNHGAGAVGYFAEPLPPEEFLLQIKQKLNLSGYRYTKGRSGRISKVAVCGGSGSDLIPAALSIKADAFITADIKYHAFHDVENRMYLVDAGHYETEVLILDEIQKRLKKITAGSGIEIFKYSGSTNPITFYN